MRNIKKMKRAARFAAVGAVALTAAFLPQHKQYAQKKDAPNVTGITSRRTAKGQVITITTDGPVSGTQTWQDPNGKFNIVLPGSGDSKVNGNTSGVQVRKLGNSLGIEVPTKPGANVTVQPRANGVDLIVEGDLDSTKSQAGAPAASSQASGEAGSRQPGAPVARPAQPSESRYVPPASSSAPAAVAPVASAPAVPSSQTNSSTSASAPPSAATNSSSSPAAPPVAPAQAPAPPEEEDGGIMSYIFSYTSLGILLVVGLAVMLILRRKSEGGWESVEEEKPKAAAAGAAPVDLMKEETARTGERRRSDRRKGSIGGRRAVDQPQALVKSSQGAQAGIEGREVTMEARQNALVPAALFGAYRVDQEVGKLLMGQPHRIDVLASRAPDDRLAMETSLLKSLNSPEYDDDSRRRARTALEEYGFVARLSAALLLAQDAYERASAARVLGEVQSPTSLPFLLEALYDSEQIVRTQAVSSIGALKLPSAIGALLDMARRYPDMPAHLISRALSACSVETLDFIDGTMSDGLLLGSGDDPMFTGEISALEPATMFEALPEWLEDETLAEALERLASTDVEARTAAAQSLAQYQVQRSVDALTALASQDPEASVRAAAVTSLGVIDHESVFAPILMAFADEAREVRAAAARALSRLNFNRADAYVRLIECADTNTLGNVAQACIKAGMVQQAVGRLASEDRRQAYEAFTLLSLVAKAGETAPILQIVSEHKDEDSCLAAVKVMGMFGRASDLQSLRELAVVDGIPESVRMALMEVVYKIDQAMNQEQTAHEVEDYSAVQIDPV